MMTSLELQCFAASQIHCIPPFPRILYIENPVTIPLFIMTLISYVSLIDNSSSNLGRICDPSLLFTILQDSCTIKFKDHIYMLMENGKCQVHVNMNLMFDLQPIQVTRV